MKTFLVLLLMLASTASAVSLAYEGTGVSRRLERQSGRISNGKSHHKMSVAEQNRADEADYRIATEEQNMRGRHKGKLTRRDKRRLNRQLNCNSRRINNDKN